jgi:hypothetical protein
VLADGIVVGRIMRAASSPVDAPWLWTLAFGHHEDRTPTHGYEATREAAMAAFAKSCSRSGDAMTTAERWRFASPRAASKRSMSGHRH